MSEDVSTLFTGPFSGIKGIANVFISVGVITNVNPGTLTCTVLSNQGLLENTRITFPQFSNGTGSYSLPNIGDICAVGFTSQGIPYLLGYGAYDALSSLKTFDRINIDYNSLVLTSNKRSMLVVSDDIHLTTMLGNQLLLNNNANDPSVVLEGSKRITMRVGVYPDTTRINIIREPNSKKTILSIASDTESEAALTFELAEQQITMTIKKNLIIKVDGGDGSELVTAKQVVEAINGHVHTCTCTDSVCTINQATFALDSMKTIKGLKTEELG